MDRGFIYLNKKNLISNLDYLGQVSQKKICLVVKANAYGHGLQRYRLIKHNALKL